MRSFRFGICGGRSVVPGFRLSSEEVWSFVADAHTGILTTLRRDGMPIAMPVWFTAVDGAVYFSTRGKKLARLRNDSRASFLVETGEAWRDLKAVHFTGTAEIVELDSPLRQLIDQDLDRKYRAFRTEAADMPESVREVYGSGMHWVKFTPDDRVLSWNNRALMGDPT